jgi:hypothetical protein
MAEPSKTLNSVRFGPFELGLDTQELRKHGHPSPDVRPGALGSPFRWANLGGGPHIPWPTFASRWQVAVISTKR